MAGVYVTIMFWHYRLCAPRVFDRHADAGGQCHEPGPIIDWTKVPCLTWAAYCWPITPNLSMAVATRWIFAWTTGPTGYVAGSAIAAVTWGGSLSFCAMMAWTAETSWLAIALATILR